MLRGRKENIEPKLIGVNRAADPIKMKLGSFTTLENFIQAHRYKIKKKRGPEPLVSCEQNPEPPAECTDALPRGQQHLEQEESFHNFDDLGGNTRTSWGYISPDGEVYTLVGHADCGGGNMGYVDACVQINHFTAPGEPLDNPALFGTMAGDAMVNTMLGTSDEPIFASDSNTTIRRAYFPDRNDSIDFESPTAPSPFGHFNTFAKKGERFYGLNGSYGGSDPFPHRIFAWDMDGSFLWESVAVYEYTHSNASATDDFLYVLLLSGSNPANPAQGIAKLDVTDGSLVSLFGLDTISPRVLFTINDDLIYILTTTGALYYLEDFTDLIYVGKFGTSLTAFAATGFFTANRFYYGAAGFGGFSPHIYSIEVGCPDGEPVIATVSAPGTVAAGAALEVTWANVLETALTDKFYLKEDSDTIFDITPAVTSSQINTGDSSGVFSFAIPGGTAPGDYVVQYVHEGVLVATSGVVTVT